MRHFSGEMNGIRLLMEDELLQVAGGEGEDTDELPQEIQANGWAGLAKLLELIGVGALGGFLGNQAATAYQREMRVASQFNPTGSTPGEAWVNVNGTNVLRPMWTDTEGNTFIDTNNNGYPDTKLRAEQNGQVFEDTGDGWHLVWSPS